MSNFLQCMTIRADVTKEEDVVRAVTEAVNAFGRIDYAANFAGIVGPPDTIVNLDVENWKTLDVNATGVMLCTKHEILQMMKQDSLEVCVCPTSLGPCFLDIDIVWLKQGRRTAATARSSGELCFRKFFAVNAGHWTLYSIEACMPWDY